MGADDVDLDLDALEWEGEKKPFSVNVGGRRYELLATAQLDWRDYAALQTDKVPGISLQRLVKPEDRQAWDANKLPFFKLNKIFETYRLHYKMDDPGEAPAS